MDASGTSQGINDPYPAPLYSVLVANYNRGEYIRECIESVLRQTYQNLELIIVDDGSTDNSVSIVREFTSRDPRVKLDQNPSNLGAGATMCRCVSLAQGLFMGFLGSDDSLDECAVDIVVKAHIENPGTSLISTSHYVCDESMNRLRLAYGAVRIPDGESYLSFGKGVTSFASFNHSLYQLTEGVNPNFKRAVDQDLYYKLEEVGGVLFIDNPVYNYRVNPHGISTEQNIAKARYWFVRAKENAFQRRSLKPSAKNIDKKELDAWWSVLYASKANVAFRRVHLCKACYWLLLSLQKSIVDKFTLLKVKALFLNTWPHMVFLTIKNRWSKQY